MLPSVFVHNNTRGNANIQGSNTTPHRNF
jgi:hypothetical protein